MTESEKDLKEDDDYCPENGNQPKKLKGKRLSVVNGNYRVAEVEKEIIYHHTKKSNKPNSSAGNMLYFFDALSKGQMFAGYIIADKDQKDFLVNTLKRKRFYFGKSKSSQYGACDVQSIMIENAESIAHKAPDSISEGETVLINLKSDAIFIDEKGNYTSNYDDVWNIIKEKINAANEDPHGSYVSVKTVCGYSGINKVYQKYSRILS